MQDQAPESPPESAGGTPPADVLSAPASRRAVEELRAAGILGDAAWREALDRLMPPRAWWTWASRALLLLGSALILAGVVFFFAYNWARMGRFLKFGLIEAGLLGCIVAAWLVGIDRLGGKLLMLAGSVLVGVLLAVYGQTYQTGADPYELFLGWGALILVWVLAARFAGLWLMWLIVVNAGIILYWLQILMPNHLASWDSMYPVLAGVNALALAGREIGAARGLAWLSHRWPRWVLLAAALVYLSIPSVALLAGFEDTTFFASLSVILAAAALGAAYLLYRIVLPDLAALTIGTTCACALMLTAIGRWIFEVSHEEGVFLLFGFIVVAVVGGAALWLVFAGRSIGGRSRG